MRPQSGAVAVCAGVHRNQSSRLTDPDEMLTTTHPEWLIVTSWDWEHHSNVIKGMRHGANIIVEKPLTIDEQKAQAILDAQMTYGKEVIVTHNYRYPPHRAKLKELLMQGLIGEITSVDFHGTSGSLTCSNTCGAGTAIVTGAERYGCTRLVTTSI